MQTVIMTFELTRVKDAIIGLKSLINITSIFPNGKITAENSEKEISKIIIDNLCYYFIFFRSILIITVICHWALSSAMSAWSLKLWSHHVSSFNHISIFNCQFWFVCDFLCNLEIFCCYRPSIWIRRQFAITFNGNWKLRSTQNAERER